MPDKGETLKTRLLDELTRYLLVSVYLFICFSVLLLNEEVEGAKVTVSLALVGIAAGKALVIGKFLLIGEALGAGSRPAARTLLQRIGLRTLSMLIVLIILKALEELIVGLLKGKAFSAITSELMQMPLLDLLAPVLLMLLILIPMITAIEMQRVMGVEQLKQIFLGEPKDSSD